MRRTVLILSALIAFVPLGHAVVAAQASDGGAIVLPDALRWEPAQGLPPGAQIAVLYGDPGKTGPFVVRFKFPAGYEVATHSHPTDEFLTVISGRARMAFGEKADEAHAQPLPANAFMILCLASPLGRCRNRHRATFGRTVRSQASALNASGAQYR